MKLENFTIIRTMNRTRETKPKVHKIFESKFHAGSPILDLFESFSIKANFLIEDLQIFDSIDEAPTTMVKGSKSFPNVH